MSIVLVKYSSNIGENLVTCVHCARFDSDSDVQWVGLSMTGTVTQLNDLTGKLGVKLLEHLSRFLTCSSAVTYLVLQL